MNALEISIREGKTNFTPGTTIAGEFSWQLQKSANALELRLIWFTQGKGTSDVSVESTQRIEAPALSGKHDFSFQLPLAPHSFAGTLIELSWALELVTIPGHDSARTDFVLAPGGQKIALSQSDTGDFEELASKVPAWLQNKIGIKKPSSIQSENPFESTTANRNS
jgi:hypothetical protein